MIARATAFGCEDRAVVFGGDFVDDADEAFVPAVFVVVGRGRRVSVPGVGEAGF